MRRREFMLVAAATALSCNSALGALQIPRIGFIQAGSRQENQGLLDSFRLGLAALGWTDASNIAVLDRWTDGRTERLSATCAVTRRRFSSRCKSRPATAPAGSSRSRHGGDEMSEAFG